MALGGVSTLNEILQLTKKIDDFILKIGTKIGGYDESIKTCKGEREIINETLFNRKNGMTVKMKAIETTLKGKQSTYGRTILTLNAFFMGGLFIMWIIKTVSERVNG